MFDPTRLRGRNAGAVIAAAATALALAACGGNSGPTVAGSASTSPGATSSGASADPASGSGPLTLWALTDHTILKEAADAYNAEHPDAKISVQLFANDDYKQKLRVAFGAGKAPDLFISWGGGALGDYVKSGKVAEITKAELDASKFTPSVVKTASFDDKVYGIPYNGLAPVVLYYNKDVLSSAGVNPPATWDDLKAAVTTLKDKGVTPISLAAGSKWPTLMWEEYLLDRFGGSEVFNKVQEGDASAWKDPSVVEANKALQELVDLGAFGKNASSMQYDQGTSYAMLATGKAAFTLMGTWEYANLVRVKKDFVKSGKLGYTTFPAVANGKGDPKAIVGNPSNYLSVNAATKNKPAALKFLNDYVLNESQVDKWLADGSVPPIVGLEDKLTALPGGDKDWLQFIYKLVSDAPNFQLSWDQALPPSPGDPLLTNIDKVFLKQITPEQFAENMSKVS